jgi:nitroreductase
MTLFETIFTRRSVRKYDEMPLNRAELSEIKQLVDEAKQLPGQRARFEIVNADKLKGCAAPHAILAYADAADAAMANIGYTLQSVDLALQSKGYGSLWMGMGKPIKPGANYRILLAFGKTDEPPRTGENDFKRNAVSDISNEDNAIARAARLAPSAVNFQPWKLHFSPGKVTLQPNGRGIGKLVAGKLQKIDLGICLKHIELALEHEGKSITSIQLKGNGKDFFIDVMYGKQKLNNSL